MAKVLSLPFQFAPYGPALTLEQGSDEYYKQQLVTLLLTMPGERQMEPDLGTPDSTFEGFEFSGFQAQVQEIFPEIIDLEVNTEYIDDTTEQVVIRFDVDVEAI